MSEFTGASVERTEIIPTHGRGKLVPWTKGKSGNPSGVQGEYHRVRKLCADKSEDGAKVLIDLMEHSDDERVRYMCAMAVIERGIGKPRDHSQEDQARSIINLDGLSDEERMLLAKLLLKTMPKEQAP